MDFTRNDALYVRWRGFSDECAMGIETYTVTLLRLDEPAGARQLVPAAAQWTELNSTSSTLGVPFAQQTSFRLPSHGFYRVRVCGAAVTGLSACAESDGVFYDTTPPTRGDLCVHAGAQTWCSDRTADTNGSIATAFVAPLHLPALRATWMGFADNESRIDRFLWALGTAPRRANVVKLVDAGWETSALIPLQPSSPPVFLSVLCVNAAGLVVGASIKIVVDATPPVIGARALLPPIGFVSLFDRLKTSFSNGSAPFVTVDPTRISDDESPLASLVLEIAVHDDPEAAWAPTVLSKAELPLSSTSVVSFGQMADLLLYHARLQARNEAGLVSEEYVSFQRDTQPPVGGGLSVCDEGRHTL